MKFFKYIGLATVCTLPLVSCSDFLVEDNKGTANSNGDEYLIQHPEQFRPVAYNAFKSIVTNIQLQDQGADLYINPRGADDGVYSLYTFNPDDTPIKTWYADLAKAINYANGMIKYNGADSKIGAEGRFLRNWGIYVMTQHFGAVPYLTEYVNSASRDYPRVPLAEIYPAMIDDLTDVYNNSSLDATSHEGYASKQAVAALLAKVCLAAAWDLDTTLGNEEQGTYTVNKTDMFELAASWAEKAINGVQLTMSFEDKWSPYNEGNAEEIFSVKYLRDAYPGNVAEGGHSLMNDYMGYFGNCVTIGQKGTGSGGTNVHSEKSLQMWEKGDQRFYATFMTTQYNCAVEGGNAVWGNQGYFAYYNASEEEKKNLRIACLFFPSWTTEAEVKAEVARLEAEKGPKITDNRIQAMAVTEQGYANPIAAIMGFDQVTYWTFDNKGKMSSKKTMGLIEYMKQTSANGMCVKKFDDPETPAVTSKNDYRDVVVFHVSDMYLVAAEAYLLAAQESQALAKINAVRGRAGLKALNSFDEYELPYLTNMGFQQTKLDLVLDERARELYAERTRWEDLRRTKQLVRYNVEFARSISSADQMRNAQGETKWYRPIPQAEMDNNTAISPTEQNPGY